MNGAESARSLRAEQPEHAGKPGDVCGQLNHIAANFPGESLHTASRKDSAAINRHSPYLLICDWHGAEHTRS